MSKCYIKHLKLTSEHITASLTKEMRELGNHTAALELRVDEIENSVQAEMENLRGKFDITVQIGRTMRTMSDAPTCAYGALQKQ